MKCYTQEQFEYYGTAIVADVAQNFDKAKVRLENGYAAIIIDEAEYEMLKLSFKICKEHPSWITEN